MKIKSEKICYHPSIHFALQVEVMKEAAKYIDQLQNSLICRIRTHGFPEKLKSAAADTAASNDVSGESIKSAVQTYLVKNNKWT